MTKELNEDSGFKISIKTLLGIGAGMAAIISMWFMLQADIAEAKELPVVEQEVTRMEFDIADAKELPAPPDPEVTRMEFDMKDQMIRQTIITTQEDVKEIKKSIEKIEDKLYE